MAQIITIAAAAEQFQNEIYDAIVAQYGPEDSCAMAEAWNDYTDSLCKDGQLNDLQYHYCPVFDDAKNMCDDWAEEIAFLLEAMGVEIDYTQSHETRECWPSSSTHWNVTIRREGKANDIETLFSMGSALKHEPTIEVVASCLLRDTDSFDSCMDFEDWSATFGYDTDSRKAYATWEACGKIATQIKEMFSSSEISDLTEIANEM